MRDGRRYGSVGRWTALAVVATVTPLAIVLTLRGASWRGEPFPGFFVLDNRTVPSVGRFEWTGIAAGVPFHSRVVAVDGRPIDDSEALYAYVDRLPIGTPVRYRFAKGDTVEERTVATMRFGDTDYWLTTGLFTVNGWMYLAAAALVLWLQPASRAVAAFFVMGVTLALFPLSASALYRSAGAWVLVLHLVSQALFPATFIHLALTFPVERRIIHERRWLLCAPYVVSAILAVASIVGLRADPPDLRPLYAVNVFAVVAIMVLCAMCGYAYVEGRSTLARRQARLIFFGVVAGTLVAVFAFVDNTRGGGHFPLNFMAVTPVVFFACVGYAIVRHDLFNVDRLVRYALEYVILTAAITLTYAATLVGAERVAGLRLRAAPALTLVFIVAVAFAFDPLRRRVQSFIDRTFFRSRPDYRRALGAMSEALTSILDLRQVVTRVGEALVGALVVERVTIGVWREDGDVYLWSSEPGHRALRDAETLRVRLEHDRAPLEREALAGLAAPADVAVREDMNRIGAALMVPLVLSGRTLGFIAVGPKRSGRANDPDDLELLITMANQATVAVHNAASYQLLQELNRDLEEKVHARTRQLEDSRDALGSAYQRLKSTQAQLIHAEKMASLGQLVAGVAHELNNPLTFIVGNVAPIRDQLAALRATARDRNDAATLAICDDMAQILGVIASGAERTATIVKDLRTFSRLEDGAWSATDLREGLRTTVNLLRPRWKDRIALHVDLDALPPVECDAAQVNQVFMNILSNACDAIVGRGNIWIRGRSDASTVAVTIRDDGDGIPAGDVSRIFDPFFTTKEIGKGTGLGLAIAHGIVERHHGRIDVATEHGRGSEFTVQLPIRDESRRRSVA